MADNQPSEEHLLYYMLFHFGSGANATVGTKKISDAYGDVLKTTRSTVQRHLKKLERFTSRVYWFRVEYLQHDNVRPHAAGGT
ncbi:hypothetical protein NECAME_16585 [Necator americanus]|uniref:Mos1 transposase HTH domain-containing protein n=1 Tax=Necator americanus TaxID=51031 RepID=W2TW54_NECAM|nr:hypothetical protein NECAME_16585 [Necator americanus]ETN85904.1 hypothetical protein NECAME_16585 [Necator americanus]